VDSSRAPAAEDAESKAELDQKRASGQKAEKPASAKWSSSRSGEPAPSGHDPKA
jgi:hypothetical protein